MQNFIPLRKLYHLERIDETDYSIEVFERYEKLRCFIRLRAEGCQEATIYDVLKVSKSTIYRWNKAYCQQGLSGLEVQTSRPHTLRKTQWSSDTENIVLAMRRKYKFFGKEKLRVMIKRDHGLDISASTIGRILKKLLLKGIIKPASYHLEGKFSKKPRHFTGHAQRWKYGMKTNSPGELIQIDHMTITTHKKDIKHFTAVCPHTKFTVHQAYRTATSSSARDFLLLVCQKLPFKVISIQVDGGSEFMSEFEKACEFLKIPLYVLPPRRPKYNAHVERTNKTVKYEFYYQYGGLESLEAVRSSLSQYAEMYNKHRPHQAIGYLTPAQFL